MGFKGEKNKENRSMECLRMKSTYIFTEKAVDSAPSLSRCGGGGVGRG